MKLSKLTSRRKLLAHFSLDEQSKLYCENTRSSSSDLSDDKPKVLRIASVRERFQRRAKEWLISE